MKHATELVEAVREAGSGATAAGPTQVTHESPLRILDAIREAEELLMRYDRRHLIHVIEDVVAGASPRDRDLSERVAAAILHQFHVTIREDVTVPL